MQPIYTHVEPPHPFNDLKYWSKRWEECFPYTYPPELFAYGGFGSICLSCKERISTGHQCKDIYTYILESRIND